MSPDSLIVVLTLRQAVIFAATCFGIVGVGLAVEWYRLRNAMHVIHEGPVRS